MDSKDFLRLQMNQQVQKPKIEVEEITTDLTADFKAYELNLHWQVENIRKGVGILSGMVDCQGFPQTFQFGLRYEEDYAVVSLTAMNLHRLGLRAAVVRLACNQGKTVVMKRKTTEKNCSKLDMFSREFVERLDETTLFTCIISLEGIVDTYVYQQYDRFLNHQVWDSVLFCCWKDFQFFIRERIFKAHKFVIGARSSRLKDEVNRVDSIRLEDGLDPDTFKCFLHFLYTGRLQMSKPPNIVQLRNLAEKYEVETLKQLCLEDLTKFKPSNFPDLFMSTVPPTIGPSDTDIHLETKSKICCKPDSAEIRITWDVNLKPQDYVITMVNFNQQEAFHVCFRSESDKRNQAVFFFSTQWPEGGLEVVTVNVAIREKSSTGSLQPRSKRLSASKRPKPARLNPAMAVFSFDLEDFSVQAPFSVIFSISLSSEKATRYLYQPRDINLAENLWLATFSAFLTDAEIKVDGRIFKVHKAMMAARSPVMRELFSSEKVNDVVVKDIDPSTFEEVLYFMYTGLLRVSADDPKLLMAAEKYEIETLRILCEEVVKGHDARLQDLCSYLQMVV